MDVSEKRLNSVGRKFNWTLEHDGNGSRGHLISVHMDLDAKGATHIFANNTHIGFGNVQMPRKNILHHVGRLGALIYRQQVFGGVVISQDAARFIGHTCVSAEFINFFNHHVGLCKGVIKAFSHKLSIEAFVVA